jgi:hypothetical protein
MTGRKINGRTTLALLRVPAPLLALFGYGRVEIQRAQL